jgi:hypothetical protein
LKPTSFVPLAVMLAALLAPSGARADAADASDPAAIELAEQVIAALGGAPRWNALPGLRWTFSVEIRDTVKSSRRHSWNKMTGWHRVEGRERSGRPFVIIHNLNDGTGKAWVDGQPIEGDSLHTLIERGKALWVNDAYWFLMPYKLLDPGVILALDTPVVRDGTTYDRLALSFDHVGLTPGDHYWVDIERGTRRVRAWHMVLEGDQPPPRTYTWEGWEQQDGLWFATAHRQGDLNIATGSIETVQTFGPTEFSAP